MEKIGHVDPGFLLRRTLGIVSTFAEGTNRPDPNLKNAWGHPPRKDKYVPPKNAGCP
jgi:hypothetical protein